jgi:hypothetical protein
MAKRQDIDREYVLCWWIRGGSVLVQHSTAETVRRVCAVSPALGGVLDSSGSLSGHHLSLLVTQGDHRIDARAVPHWDDARDQSHDQQQ